MKRRWSRAAIVACLVLLAAACRTAESSRPAPERPAGELVGAEGGEGPRRSAFGVMVDWLVTIGLGRRWRAGAAELVDEDKRRVPTGPNPLHNR